MCGAACGGCKREGRSNNIWMDSRLSVNMGMTAQESVIRRCHLDDTTIIVFAKYFLIFTIDNWQWDFNVIFCSLLCVYRAVSSDGAGVPSTLVSRIDSVLARNIAVVVVDGVSIAAGFLVGDIPV